MAKERRQATALGATISWQHTTSPMFLLAQVVDSLGPLANPELRNNLVASVVGLVALSILRLVANRLINQQLKDPGSATHGGSGLAMSFTGSIRLR